VWLPRQIVAGAPYPVSFFATFRLLRNNPHVMSNQTISASANSALDRIEASLDAIDRHGTRTNAFIRVDADAARAAARVVDEERRRGIDRGPVHGMPISIKDLIDIAGQPTTAASQVRAEHGAVEDATIVLRLRKAGAILIGKTNLHEFALGTTTDVSAWGPVRNPVDESRSAGGSSGGSAAAVATGMGEASIGSDTGGSIRIPAAACGVVGLKPTFGEVPLNGVVPLSRSLDHVGPLARTVEDVAALWAVLTDRHPAPVEPLPPRALTLGALGDYFTAYLDDDVRTAFGRAVASLQQAGVTIEPRSVSGTETIIETYASISLSEAAHWHAHTLDTRGSDYQPSVRERLESGRAIRAVDYLRALDARSTLREAVDQALAGCSALLLPTLPIVAPLLGQTEVAFGNGNETTLTVRAAMLRLTQLFNITGHPAISLPMPVAGLPVGLQLVGRWNDTPSLLSVALTCERVLAR
jgi:aspartyl-tRNA(Asn)/glutamyl-tRNA(Gln) amidotransferase subunit A